MKEKNMRARLWERVKKFVNVDAPNVWNSIRNGILSLVVKYVERKKAEGFLVLRDDGMGRRGSNKIGQNGI